MTVKQGPQDCGCTRIAVQVSLTVVGWIITCVAAALSVGHDRWHRNTELPRALERVSRRTPGVFPMNRNLASRGVILVSVLWIVMILSVTSLSLATAVRTQLSATGNTFDAQRAFFMAQGAAEVMFHQMVQNQNLFADSRIEQDGAVFVFPMETGEVRAHFETGRSHININLASAALVASMMDSLGVDRVTRNQLVGSILDWRDADDIPNLYGAELLDYDQVEGLRLPANGPFESVDELRLLKGMREDLFYGRIVKTLPDRYSRIPGIQDIVTVDSDIGGVNPNEASVNVLAALPGMDRNLAEAIVRVRTEAALSSSQDLIERLPSLDDSEVFNFLLWRRRARHCCPCGNAAFGGFPDRANDPAARRGVGVPSVVRQN